MQVQIWNTEFSARAPRITNFPREHMDAFQGRTAAVSAIKVDKKNEFFAWCMYRICFQAAIFKPKYNFYMLPVFLTCEEQSREDQATRHLYETRRGIYSTQLKLRKKTLFCKSTEKYVHCYPAYTAAFSRMNYCRSTVVTTYLSCLSSKGMVRFNGNITLI